MVLLIDDETNTYWDHITGDALHGPQAEAGSQLPVWGIEMSTAEVEQERYPETTLHHSQGIPLLGRAMAFLEKWMTGKLPPGFRGTMAESDARLPEMAIGLGVVADRTRRFYPRESIGDGLRDRLDDRDLDLRIHPESQIPEAIWSDGGGRPLQLFSRWYGFSFTYPGCEIYGSEVAPASAGPDDRSTGADG